MRLHLTALLLPVALASAPATAQTTSWSGSSLTFTGGSVNGCQIRLTSATHSGGGNSQIRLIFANDGPDGVRITGEAVLTQGGNRASRLFSVGMGAGISAFTPGPNPGGVTVAGSVLQVSVTACQKR